MKAYADDIILININTNQQKLIDQTKNTIEKIYKHNVSTLVYLLKN